MEPKIYPMQTLFQGAIKPEMESPPSLLLRPHCQEPLTKLTQVLLAVGTSDHSCIATEFLNEALLSNRLMHGLSHRPIPPMESSESSKSFLRKHRCDS